jgi:hypothetical protein
MTAILLDTCESGALVNGYARSRVNDPASEAALGRLNEATGRPVLTRPPRASRRSRATKAAAYHLGAAGCR